MSKIQLIATAPFGLEAVVAREVRNLGYDEMTVENGSVTFTGDEAAICRANLWLRTADRVLIKMGAFKADSFESLFQQTKALPWDQWLPENACFPVQGKSIRSKLFSVPDCQAIVKKAVVEKMKQKYRREWFDEDGPLYTIEVALLKDEAVLTIDTSGAGLHKRGYRKLTAQAPLKETLAAAMISLAHWFWDRPLVDPFCGSGTIPIEAAMVGLNMAPGLKRSFAAENWGVVPAALWRQAREEAQDLLKRDRVLDIFGSDHDDKVLSLAGYHARSAGVDKQIRFRRLPVSQLEVEADYGYIICNPPYGERMGENKEVERLYREMGRVFASFGTWSFYILTAYPWFEQLFGRQASKRRKLYNGRIECQYYQYFGPRPPRNARETEEIKNPDSTPEE